MGEILYPSPQNNGDSDLTALTSRFAGGSAGWIGKSNNNYLAHKTSKVSGAPLNACAYVADGVGSQATFDTFEAFVGGKYLARDTQTSVDISGQSANTWVHFYLGYNRETADGVKLGLTGDFAAQDPKIEIGRVHLDSNGAIEANSWEDRRPLGYRTTNVDDVVHGSIPAARLGANERARQFDWIPAGKEIYLTELYVAADNGLSRSGLFFKILNNETGAELYSTEANNYQTATKESPLVTIQGQDHQKLTFDIVNQTNLDPGVFSARWKYYVNGENWDR